MIKKLAWFGFFGLLSVSCLDDPDCYNLSNNIIGISFKKIADGQADTVAVIGITMDGTDSIFSQTTLATGVYLPLNYLANQSTIVVERLGILGPFTNTIVLSYDAKAQFVSEDCAERFVVSKLEVASSDFDSTNLVSNTPTKNPSTNINVYRCPVSDFVRFSFRQWTTDEELVQGNTLAVRLNSVSDDFTNGSYYTGFEGSTFRLPVNGSAPMSSYEIAFEKYGNTSITLGYSATSGTLYVPCGEQQFFTDILISNYSTEFDKVVVLNDSIEDPPVTNVAFYKCPSTNLVKIVFRESANSSASAPVDIALITADYTTEQFYNGVNEVSTLELPLNENATTTTFTFTFADNSVRTLQLNYVTSVNQYHEVCNQTEMSSLAITATDFSASQVIDATVQFPTVNNIAIIY
jgi:hypothetical protein